MSNLILFITVAYLPPATKLGQVMFLHVSVILFTEGVSRPPPMGEVEGSDQGGLQTHTQGGRLRGMAGGVSRPTPREGVCLIACWDTLPPPDGYFCGRYASYWNAFLFWIEFRGKVSLLRWRLLKIVMWSSRSSQIAGLSTTQQLLLYNNTTFDDIILQHLMTFWMTCIVWILIHKGKKIISEVVHNFSQT